MLVDLWMDIFWDLGNKFGSLFIFAFILTRLKAFRSIIFWPCWWYYLILINNIMKLQNNSRSVITTSKGDFKIKSIMDFDDDEGRKLLRYKGVDSVKALEAKEIVEEKLKTKPSKSKAKTDKKED